MNPLLADLLQVLRLELPAGEHVVSLRPADVAGPMGTDEQVTVTIDDARNTYLLANFPESRLVGDIVTSNSKSSSP